MQQEPTRFPLLASALSTAWPGITSPPPPAAPPPSSCCSVAEACVATLQEMNPFVKVSALPGPLSAALAPEALQQHDLLLLCGQPAGTVAAADAACRQAGVAFYAGACRGIYGWAFADLQEHRYVVEVRFWGWGAVGSPRLASGQRMTSCPALQCCNAALVRVGTGEGCVGQRSTTAASQVWVR